VKKLARCIMRETKRDNDDFRRVFSFHVRGSRFTVTCVFLRSLRKRFFRFPAFRKSFERIPPDPI
jgi:hypothetical protein